MASAMPRASAPMAEGLMCCAEEVSGVLRSTMPSPSDRIVRWNAGERGDIAIIVPAREVDAGTLPVRQNVGEHSICAVHRQSPLNA